MRPQLQRLRIDSVWEYKKWTVRAIGQSILLFAQHERTLTGVSPQAALTVGRLQPKARVSIVRWNLKEAVGKHLT
ncbi:MAG: hypothetical protein IK005_02300, partial [Paludibacteraceae bacterium]|nr:hypothetical protein [Paludibacteraceae bacterium]